MSSSKIPEDLSIQLISDFYDCFPFPPDPLIEGPPPGYNWRWCVDAAFAYLTGSTSPMSNNANALRILDAGCGSGVSTDYLAHLNPGSDILAVDVSEGAINLARKRLTLSGANKQANLTIIKRNILHLKDESPFDYINSVGVLHHLKDPHQGLKALASCLKEGGLLHLFLYAEGGRWAVQRAQTALKIIGLGYDQEALRLGRQFFSSLPFSNKLRLDYEQRWADDCLLDTNFADVYLHPQEKSYNLETLFELLKSVDLQFLGFSNPGIWSLERLLEGELLARALSLPQLQQWKLIEALDSEISHFEFFLAKDAVQKNNWTDDDSLMEASGQVTRCLWGWPGNSLLDFEMNPIQLSQNAIKLMKAIEVAPKGTPLRKISIGIDSATFASLARDLIQKQVLLVSPT